MGEKNDNYDITKIRGYQFMDEEEKTFFENYGEALEKQSELVVEQYKTDIEGMEKEYDEILQDAIKEDGEYIVDGALLECANGRNEIRDLYYESELLHSEPKNIDKMSRLTILEDRAEKINEYFIPASVEDSTGGLQDDINQNGKVNILSFGNCGEIPDGADLKAIIEQCNLTDKTEEIINAIKEGKGTCYCFMKLNEEGWENLSTVGDYLSGNFPVEAGISKALSFRNSYLKYNDIEGINMFSMLFCNRFAGIINAKESGQNNHIFNKFIEPDITVPAQVKEYMWFFYLDKGMSCEVVAGILGNAQRECEFNLPWAEQYNPTRFGVFQWSKSDEDVRNIEFHKWVNENGLNENLISTQCEFAYYEMINYKGSIILDVNENNSSELLCSYATLLKAQTPEEAALIFATFFERCCTSHYKGENDKVHYKDIQHSKERQDNARTIYDEMKDL